MRALVIFAVFLAGCQTTWREGATIRSSSGQTLCAKHRIPLVPIRVYSVVDSPGMVTFVHAAEHPYWGMALQHCPNIISEAFVRRPFGNMRKPRTVLYCPLCEKEFYDELRVPDEKSAIAYATYVLSIRSFTATKGPYEVTLRGDVWTVRCFLVDG